MSMCPKCGEDIDSLDYTEDTRNYGIVRVDGDGDVEWEQQHTDPLGTIWYTCPECGQVLFNSDAEAAEFLRRKR